MPDAPLSRSEDARLSALEKLNLLEAQATPDFDIFPLLASKIFATPIAAITLVGRDTQWIKAGVGIREPSLPRTYSICEYAILQPSDILTIQDAKSDARVSDKPCVAAEGGIRSYAGMAITSPDGLPLGALCVADQVPRSFQPDDLEKLKELAGGVERAIKLHAAVEQDRRRSQSGMATTGAGEIASELSAYIGKVITPLLKSSFHDHRAKNLLTSMFARIDAPILLVDKSGGIMMANAAFRSLVGFSPEKLKSMKLDQFIIPVASGKNPFEDGHVHRIDCDITIKTGGRTAVRLTSVIIDFEQHSYKVVTLVPPETRLDQPELSAEFNLYVSQSMGEFRPISLAALRSALGNTWARVSLRAMLSAERIIRKRLERDDVLTRLDDETFAVWFNNADRLQNDEALAIINRELRVRLLTEFGDELRDYLQLGVSQDDETLVTAPPMRS